MIDVAFANPQERQEIADFMAQVFPRAKWGRDAWLRLLDGRWSGADLPYAVTARDDGRLVGVMGLVSALRPTEQGPALTANMSSWYILHPYRGCGLGGRMIACATALPDVTITDLTSSKLAVGAVQRAGLVPLDIHRCLWTPRPADRRLPLSRAEARAGDLPSEAQQILRDLAGLPPDRVEEIPVPRFYTPGRMAPENVDHLYSEVMLLDMKLD